jgi:hypothetical protein
VLVSCACSHASAVQLFTASHAMRRHFMLSLKLA